MSSKYHLRTSTENQERETSTGVINFLLAFGRDNQEMIEDRNKIN